VTKCFKVGLVTLAVASTLAFGQAAAPANGAAGGAQQQKTMAVLAGMRSDLSLAMEENQRLNARIEELEERAAAQDRKIDELQKLCVSLNERIQNQDKASADRMKALQSALEEDQRKRQQEDQKLAKELTTLIKTSAKPAAPPKPAYSGKVYELTVASGDTLSTIAKAAGVTVKEIMEINGLKSADKLQVGQVLQIPAKGK